MAFMEQITSKSKDVTQKAKDMTEQTKLKNLMKSEQEKVQSLFAILGKLYYENETENLKEPYAEIVRTVKISLDKVEEYQQKVASIKSKYICPNCGAPVTSTTQFCKKCGTKISNFT